MNHRQALHTLARFILGGQVRPPDVEEAKMHVSTCEQCVHQFAALSRALSTQPSLVNTESRTATCARCLDRLPEYVEDELRGMDVERRYPQLAGHIRRCAACGEKYELLRELLRLDEAAGLVPHYPGFDEQFLLAQTALELPHPAGPALVRRGRDYLVWLREELGEEVALLMVRLADVLAAPPRPAYAHRGPAVDRAGELLAHFVVGTEELADLESNIYVYRDRDDPDRCRALVEVNVPSRWPDFSGSRVVMTNGEESLSALTGGDGRVLFEDIPVTDVGRLVFAIVPVTAEETGRPAG